MRSLRSVYSEKPELQPQSNKSFVIRYSEFVVLKLIFMSHCYLSLGLFCFDGCVLLEFYFLFSFSMIICFASHLCLIAFTRIFFLAISPLHTCSLSPSYDLCLSLISWNLYLLCTFELF